MSLVSIHAQETPVSFNRDIRPVLAKNCFACHGPDEDHQEAGLRIDIRESAIEGGAFEPGSPDESEMIARINSDDPDEVMPPPHAHPQLSPVDRELIAKWIEQGGDYEPHWAFVPPKKAAPPELTDVPKGWDKSAIDAFVLRELKANGLSVSKPANAETLVRRVYLDLIGLPPSRDEAFQFAGDFDEAAAMDGAEASNKVFESLVDRLLASPRYGERWARPWLDLARYADTNGYEKDRPRSIWPYRDWVIRALNEDKPFDQFSIEQLAGDMLDDPTPDQLVATGFHRNTMLNEEGGIDPLEYRFMSVVDRVATTGTVWMGLTTGCAQCHTHKYDPITHTDYYAMMALLNNCDEPDFSLKDAGIESRRADLLVKIRAAEDELLASLEGSPAEGTEPEHSGSKLAKEFVGWKSKQRRALVPWSTVEPSSMTSNLAKLTMEDDGSIFVTGDTTKRDVYELVFDADLLAGLTDGSEITAIRFDAMLDPRLPGGGPGRTYFEGRVGDFFLSELTATMGDQPVEFSNGSVNAVAGRPVSEELSKKNAVVAFDGDGSSGWKSTKDHSSHLVLNLSQPLTVLGDLKLTMLFERHYPAALGKFKVSFSVDRDAKATPLPIDVEAVLRTEETEWSKEDHRRVSLCFLERQKELLDAVAKVSQLKNSLPAPPKTLVMQARAADNERTTYRHHRGEYQSPKEKVSPAIMTLFQDQTDLPVTNRLEFANWLTSQQNPLVGRVAVNRAWRQFFGAGLVETDGDFGTQSSPPSHPELLDYLVCQFLEGGQSMKQLHRMIVTSATYRQSSSAGKSGRVKDPSNRLLGRGPRFRVDGEMVRDIMLKSSGLMSEKMYGPGVRPPQPASVTALAYGATKWNAATGEDRYRRSVYTFVKRTAAFAAYTVFDSPTGENCTARRNRSNTPLQALTLLNDEMYLEMARALAVKSMDFRKERFMSSSKVDFIFESVLTRSMTMKEKDVLYKYYRTQQQRLASGELKASEILQAKGEGGSNDGGAGKEDKALIETDNELAALTMVARAVINLDEAITKQ